MVGYLSFLKIDKHSSYACPTVQPLYSLKYIPLTTHYLFSLKGSKSTFWPLLGIGVELLVLTAFILVYERNRRIKKSKPEPPTLNDGQASGPSKSSSRESGYIPFLALLLLPHTNFFPTLYKSGNGVDALRFFTHLITISTCKLSYAIFVDSSIALLAMTLRSKESFNIWLLCS